MRHLTLLSLFGFSLLASSYGQTLTQSPTAFKSTQPNTSGLSFTNLNSNSPAAASNGKNLTVDASGNVILTLDPGAVTQYWQLTGNDLANTNLGAVKITNLQAGASTTAVAGMIRYTGTDLQGYVGGAWKSLTGSAPLSFWATASSFSNCSTVCPGGYTPALDQNGKNCKNAKGFTGTSVTRCTFSYTSGGVLYSEERWGCDSPARTSDYDYQLTQCHCIKVN